MQVHEIDRLGMINRQHTSQIREAEQARQVDRAVRDVPRPTHHVRRVIGASIVRFGTRLAGEPIQGLVRSR